MDKGFAGVVAVAILGCAVVLAIAFQISEGLAMQAGPRGGPAGTGQPSLEANPGGASAGRAHTPEPAAVPAWNDAAGWESGTGDGAAADPYEPSATTTETAEIAPSPGAISTAREPRPTPAAKQRTPPAAKEINPVEGHTVSPEMADEIGERARKGARREEKQSEAPQMANSDPVASSARATSVSAVSSGVTMGETPPAIEMIRGTRRSTEPVTGTENND